MTGGACEAALREVAALSRRGTTARLRVRRVDQDGSGWREDLLAVEEPLEVRVCAGGAIPPCPPLMVTMRTPGHDFELAAGLLYSEGVLRGRDDLDRITYCTDGEQWFNAVNVVLRPGVRLDPAALRRLSPATSACGVCGKASIDAVRAQGVAPLPPGPPLDAGRLRDLPEALARAQTVFAQTGGLHAAALFDAGGRLLALREDVGRHNAVDKLVGWALLDGRLPLEGHVLLVSGRVGFEIAQKALVARIPVVAAVSAPSSLAVDLAREFGLTLIGFLRGPRFNVYSGEERLALPGRQPVLP